MPIHVPPKYRLTFTQLIRSKPWEYLPGFFFCFDGDPFTVWLVRSQLVRYLESAQFACGHGYFGAERGFCWFILEEGMQQIKHYFLLDPFTLPRYEPKPLAAYRDLSRSPSPDPDDLAYLRSLLDKLDDQALHSLWREACAVTVDKSGGIEAAFYQWPRGMHYTILWRWFHQRASGGLAALLLRSKREE